MCNDRSGSAGYEYLDSLNRDASRSPLAQATGAERCRSRSVALSNSKLSSLLRFFNPTPEE
jgi:hypothetical protein